MSRCITVAAQQVPASGGRSLLAAEGRSIALFNVDGQLYAIDDSGPHQGASLCGGRLEGKVIQCCAHRLRFDLATGYLINSSQLRLACYPVEVEGEQVSIVIAPEECTP